MSPRAAAVYNKMNDKEKNQRVGMTQSPDFSLIEMLWQDLNRAVHEHKSVNLN